MPCYYNSYFCTACSPALASAHSSETRTSSTCSCMLEQAYIPFDSHAHNTLYHLLVLPLATAPCLSCKTNIMILCSTPDTQTSTSSVALLHHDANKIKSAQHALQHLLLRTPLRITPQPHQCNSCMTFSMSTSVSRAFASKRVRNRVKGPPGGPSLMRSRMSSLMPMVRKSFKQRTRDKAM